MTKAIEATRLTKTFGSGDAQVIALKDLSFSADQGEFVAIMGPSGCGKSTLLNILAGLDRPTEGSVTLEGERIDQLSESRLAKLRRKKVGFVFQFFNLIPTLTAGENVELPMRLVGRRRKVRQSANALLAQLGVQHKRDVAPSLLSGGEQQRVALARALANSPQFIFADEPTGNLDTASAKEVLALLRQVRQEGQTLVVVTHDARVAAAADRVVTMRDGEITREQLLADIPTSNLVLEVGQLA